MCWHRAGAAGGSWFLVTDFLFGETGSIYHDSLYTIFRDKLAAVVFNLALSLVHLQIKGNYIEINVPMAPVTEEKGSVVYKVGCMDRVNP